MTGIGEIKNIEKKMKRNVGILIFDNVEVLDFCGPFEVFSVTTELNQYGPFEVFTVASTKAAVTTVNGMSVNPRYSFNDAPPIDILVIPGGAGTRALVGDQETLNWLFQRHSLSEITFSVCSGARLIGILGLLDHLPYTTHRLVFDHMAEIAPDAIPVRNERFVDNGKIMTSGGISAGIDLSLHIVGKLLGERVRTNTSTYMEYPYAQTQ